MPQCVTCEIASFLHASFPKSSHHSRSLMTFRQQFDFSSSIFIFITVFENHQKSRIFKNSPKLTIFGLFNELLSTQNGNVARFARNVECDFLCGFQPLCLSMNVKVIYATRWSQNPAEEKKLALTNWTQHFMLHSLAHQFTRFQNHPKKSHFSKMRNFLK